MDSLKKDLEEMQQEWAIARLIDEIALDLDQGEIAKACENFTEDAVFSLYDDGRLIFEAQSAARIRETMAERTANWDTRFHNNGTRRIVIDPLQQSADSTTLCMTFSKNAGGAVQQEMIYHDELIRSENRWYIQKRTVQIAGRSEYGL